MSTFSQFWKSYAKNGVRQFTWVCGSELVLVDEVVRMVTDAVDPHTSDYFPMDASENSADSIWSSILQYPLSPRPRLIVVREAQRLDTARILDVLKKRRYTPDTFVVFVSSEKKIPKEEVGEKVQRPEHLRAFSGRGFVVECGAFTQATAQTAVEWVTSFKKMRKGVAGHLLERSNGDLRLTRDLCRKLALFDEEPTIAMVNELLREYPRDSFSHALLALDKKTALLCLRDMPAEDYVATVGMLDAYLDLAGLVHDMLVEHRSTPEISKAAGNRRFLVPEILPVARHYDSKRRSSIRRLLYQADEVLRRGEKTGVMESIVAFW